MQLRSSQGTQRWWPFPYKTLHSREWREGGWVISKIVLVPLWILFFIITGLSYFSWRYKMFMLLSLSMIVLRWNLILIASKCCLFVILWLSSSLTLEPLRSLGNRTLFTANPNSDSYISRTNCIKEPRILFDSKLYSHFHVDFIFLNHWFLVSHL
jgi:hypothetical protein